MAPPAGNTRRTTVAGRTWENLGGDSLTRPQPVRERQQAEALAEVVEELVISSIPYTGPERTTDTYLRRVQADRRGAGQRDSLCLAITGEQYALGEA